MSEFLFGALGAIMILAAFSSGFVSACWLTKKFHQEQPQAKDETSPEEKRKREQEIKEMDEAFAKMMGYNLNVAYGLDPDELEGSDAD